MQALGHVVPTGGAAASSSISIDALGSAQHHCREAAGGAPPDDEVTAPAASVAATTLPTADLVSSLDRPTSSSAVPGSVFALGHVVPTGGAAASSSISIDALGSAQHHCREAAGGAPKLTNAQVKKLPKKARAKYKAQLEALEAQEALHAESKVNDKKGAEGDSAPMPRGSMPHFARDATFVPSASSAPASAVSATGTGSGAGTGERPGQQVTFAGGPGDQGADLGRD